MWPEKYPVEALEELKATLGTREWQSLYQQQPVSDADIIFEPQWLQFYQTPPTNLQLYQSWDLSFGATGESSSWVVGQVWGVSGKQKYLLHMSREQMGFSATIAAIKSMQQRYPQTHSVYIEEKANGAAAIDVLQSDPAYRGQIIPTNPTASKAERAYEVVPQFERGEVWLPDPCLYPWVKPLLTELELFPKSATDDCVDAMTQLLSQVKGAGIEHNILVGSPGNLYMAMDGF